MTRVGERKETPWVMKMKQKNTNEITDSSKDAAQVQRLITPDLLCPFSTLTTFSPFLVRVLAESGVHILLKPMLHPDDPATQPHTLHQFPFQEHG